MILRILAEQHPKSIRIIYIHIYIFYAVVYLSEVALYLTTLLESLQDRAILKMEIVLLNIF